MTPAITVRWVTSESWTAVKERAWQVLHDASLGTLKHNFVPRRYPSVRETAAVAETDIGDIVGVVTIAVRPEEYNDQYGPFHELPGPRAFVLEIGVAPAARRDGVGRSLLRAAAQEIRRRGAVRLALDVDRTSDETERRAFFANCGLRSLRPDRHDDILGATVDEVIAATRNHSVT
jgi:GNAT superfamily N-acetyltransferase